ncbi:hypothetical protein SLEP1_g44290 [Rubroshorea leprosula]|uniref:Integrase catalytic domain-containing protein n=1 Tax=Rubroshorea leprosula TaxID=152421 RepID=A0AAV5LG69_9ROSI|nr:hypothetical protein SLEP1_g44290 [Rubroshorea leprosula]
MSSSSTNSFSSLPMFNGENYDFWAIRMKAFLKGNDVWEVIEHGFQLPFPQENPTVAQMKRNTKYNVGTDRALSFLHNAVANDIFPKVASCQNAQEVWEALKEEYEGSAGDKSVTLLALKQEFEMLKMKETNTIQSCDLSRLSIKALTGKLQAHEKRLAMRFYESVEGAFHAKHKGKYLVARIDWQRINHLEKDYWHKGKPRFYCKNCKKHGHTEKFCKADQVQYRPKQVQQANFIGDQNEEDYMFVAMHSCFVTSEDSWYVDSGCTNHMVRDVKLFTKLDRSIQTRVRLGNGYVVQAEGKGNVSIQTKEVKYTPQQNGSFERKNRTVMEMARSMLFEKNLPKKFWAEAVHTVVYLLNGLPTRAIEGKTPIEVWIGLKPSTYHLKVFGSICYMHVPATRRTKLDGKAEMGILVGYAA